MSQIRCPHCNQVFTIDESEYQKIVVQIRDQTLKEEVSQRTKQIEQGFEQQKKAVLSEQEAKHQRELNDLHQKLQAAQAKLQEAENQTKIKILEAEQKEQKAKNELEQTVKELKVKLDAFNENKKNEIARVEAEAKAKVTELETELKTQASQAELEKKKTEEVHAEIIRLKDEEIAKYKDFKLRLSTKMIGESLEQYCLTEFNKIRAAFPSVYFEKDNDASGGSKGDFIYREKDSEGNEVLSIMFEMKNEADMTATKHKNEDFFDKLDKDRIAKKCEYAVLVSMLEPENEYYNAGIVDVSYKYEKMYVIRPQCFIPMITILRSAAMNALKAKQELAVIKQQQIDVTGFEEKLNAFKDRISRNYGLAEKKYDDALERLDKAIAALQKMREELAASKKYLRIATEQFDDITIRKLTNGNPTMKRAFEEAKKKEENTIDSTADEE